ncbi:MAG TPA: DUF2442 domain-containing protein [Candidatus Binatia bacterium]|nr:DUF2442 domain-containing protein [Candidatus Binatia bacterium]
MKRSLEDGGTGISPPEICEISARGVTLLIDEEELFLSYADFPWFKGRAASDVHNVVRPQPHHLRWPALDIDLDIESIRHSERFPLLAR